MPVNREVSLRGLPDRLVAELLYCLQIRTAREAKAKDHRMRHISDQLRLLQLPSLETLGEDDLIRAGMDDDLRMIIRGAQTALRRLGADCGDRAAHQSLRLQRDDEGHELRLLSRTDMVSFCDRVAFLAEAGVFGAHHRVNVIPAGPSSADREGDRRRDHCTAGMGTRSIPRHSGRPVQAAAEPGGQPGRNEADRLDR
ncbi:hypothetical protein [Streptomyces sp. NPDC057781]|uniref:hypothetical protein n=1 Tax=unclassified Streptomyces TaxID=2593676 RepID=UPI0036BAEE25